MDFFDDTAVRVGVRGGASMKVGKPRLLSGLQSRTFLLTHTHTHTRTFTHIHTLSHSRTLSPSLCRVRVLSV